MENLNLYYSREILLDTGKKKNYFALPIKEILIDVYIDRKKKNPVQVIRKFISKTKRFESVSFLVFLVILFSVLSYLLTLNAVHNFLLR